jgi:LmbE family N-acetylglucosaminyl deacetylase
MTTGTRRGRRALAFAALTGLSAVQCASAQAVDAAVTPAAATAGSPVDVQSPAVNRGTTAVWEDLERLRTWASLMMITAHPDDEDGGLIAYEARGVGARVALFTLTRGEGGQNAMSAAENDALGLIRTHELLRAGSWYGNVNEFSGGVPLDAASAEDEGQYWGTVADYGFSKTLDEALSQWGHERVLYDAVRAVRLYRPLVVTSVFAGAVTDGHGQHQVAGLLAQEVFKAAADPKMFPDQIAAGLQPWQPMKVYERVPSFFISPKGMFDYATSQWAPVRFRNYVDNTWIEGTPSVDVQVPEGTRDPVMGETYVQMAREGLGQQKSQHEGPVVPLAGPATVAYHRYAAALPNGAQPAAQEQSFFDGIDTSLPGMAVLAHGGAPFLRPALVRLRDLITEAALNYIPAQPEKTADRLAEGAKATAALLQQVEGSGLSAEDKANLGHELRIKLAQFNAALVDALGIQAFALTSPSRSEGDAPYQRSQGRGQSADSLPLTPEETAAVVTPGESFRVRVHVAMTAEVELNRVSLETPPGSSQTSPSDSQTSPGDSPEQPWRIARIASPGLENLGSRSGDVLFSVTVPQGAAATSAYFTRSSVEQPYYDILDPRWRNLSFAPYPLSAVAEFTYHGVPIRVAQGVETMQRVLGLGAVYAPVLVAPAVSVDMQQHAGVAPLSGVDFTLPVRVRGNSAEESDGNLRLDLPAGWSATPASAEFRLKSGQEQTVPFKVHPAGLSTSQYTLKAVAQSGNYSYDSSYDLAGYSGLPPYPLSHPAVDMVRGVDVKVAANLNVGYVMGTGDDVPQALEELGVHPHLLSREDLLSGDLSHYDAIVLGIRAYSARPELPAATARLLQYVHNGGALITQYESGEWDHDYAPFPYVLGRNPEKVVDERAPVTLLDPNHPLFTFPNHITAADFDGWVEERGHSFLQSWSLHYTALTETHDPGQAPQRGGLLYARYGKGIYVYAAYALYRQTPEGVPGAFRILANLVSAGREPASSR